MGSLRQKVLESTKRKKRGYRESQMKKEPFPFVEELEREGWFVSKVILIMAGEWSSCRKKTSPLVTILVENSNSSYHRRMVGYFLILCSSSFVIFSSSSFCLNYAMFFQFLLCELKRNFSKLRQLEDKKWTKDTFCAFSEN